MHGKTLALFRNGTLHSTTIKLPGLNLLKKKKKSTTDKAFLTMEIPQNITKSQDIIIGRQAIPKSPVFHTILQQFQI